MNYYRFMRPFLFALPPDWAHFLTLRGLRFLSPFFSKLTLPFETPPVALWGLSFPHICGLAAGFDKNAVALEALFALGFSFIEVGAVTPQPQAGNQRPHMRRYEDQESILNRCGFNNAGVEALATRLREWRERGVPGILAANLGKNKETPPDKAAQDYAYCMRQLYPYVDLLTINISSPNTLDLRSLEKPLLLDDLLQQLMATREVLADQYQKRIPLLVKVSPDLSDASIAATAEVMLQRRVDGLIATNTSVEHESLGITSEGWGGGLSGRVLKQKARHSLCEFYRYLGDRIPIVSVGGIDSVEEAQWRLDHGARLLQIYSAFVYQGPELLRDIAMCVSSRAC